MAVRPEDRYPSARALAEEIEHWLADEPVSAWGEPPTQRARRWARRHRPVVAAAAAALVAAVVFALLYADRQSRHAAAQSQARQRIALLAGDLEERGRSLASSLAE